MAKIFSIIFKSCDIANGYNDRIQKTYSWLKSEYENETKLKTINNGEIFHFLLGYNDDLNVDVDKGLLGFTNSEGWYKKDNYPDGNYFIYKLFKEEIELNSDFTGSRNIWYYFTDDYFIFSSIQIPIIIFKESFKLNSQIIGWIISSGSLGPENSWDNEIKILPRASILHFSFKDCIVRIQDTSSFGFNDSYFRKGFKNIQNGSIGKNIESLKFSNERTVHLLSGGIESRFLFHSLALKKNLPCLTWTTKEGKNSINSDFGVAKTLKESFGVVHFEYIIDDQIYDPQVIFDNFLKFGEGRIDHIFSYLDNFRLWRQLAEQNITSVVRGDHNFGRYKAYTEKQSKKSLGCQMHSDIKLDFFNEIAKSQNSPLFLNKKPSESLNEYSARLGLDFRLPYVNSSLNDLKLAFVEINNPLLNNSLVQLSEKLNTEFLLNKSLLKSINDKKIKGVPYATSHYTENNDYVLEKYFKEFIVGRIEYNLDLRYFSKLGFDEFEINKLKNRLKKVRSEKNTQFSLKAILPKKIKKFLNQFKSQKVSDIRIAFRLVLIIEMVNKINNLTQNQ